MDPVYTATIIGMVILFGGVFCGFTFYVYKECRSLRQTQTQTQYTRV
jgi:hypothetical protein